MTIINPISTDEILDSGDLNRRRDALEHDLDLDPTLLDEDEQIELGWLRTVCDEGADYFEDWEYGVTLIRDDYFEEYAREFANDIGAFSTLLSPTTRQIGWPFTCIDWEKAADELQVDYTTIRVDGVDYWAR